MTFPFWPTVAAAILAAGAWLHWSAKATVAAFRLGHELGARQERNRATRRSYRGDHR